MTFGGPLDGGFINAQATPKAPWVHPCTRAEAEQKDQNCRMILDTSIGIVGFQVETSNKDQGKQAGKRNAFMQYEPSMR